ncbi:Elongator subunit elp2 [Bonamia ostreae]|uniref:Elongator complex protein 2 n=1 Tax=Bonamia ostreae TaxID=126728 RepID=A0ABV2AH79_9EUKA
MITENLAEFVGFNPVPNCLDCNNDTVVYAAKNNIVVCYINSDVAKKIQIFNVSDSEISTVKIISKQRVSEETVNIVTGNKAGQVKFFSKSSNSNKIDFQRQLAKTGDPVVDVIYIHSPNHSSGDFLIVAHEKSVVVYKNNLLIQEIQNEGVLNFAVTCHSKKTLFLAMAGVDSKIHVFSANVFSEKTFQHRLSFEGHSDWIKSIKFVEKDFSENVFLASAGQDSKVIVWRLSLGLPEKNTLEYFKVSKLSFSVGESNFCFEKKSVLRGHTSNVTSVDWIPSSLGEETESLLTSSMDGTARIWELEDAASKDIETHQNFNWSEAFCCKETRGKGGGFLAAVFSGNKLIAASKSGALHVWARDINNLFKEVPFPTGHNDAIESVAWDRKSGFLYSCGSDKTARVFAYKKATSEKSVCRSSEWREISRPQLHGHKILSIRPLSFPPFSYISAAEETCLRIFTATKKFAELFPNEADGFYDERVDFAGNSELNLCNKPEENRSIAANNAKFCESDLWENSQWQEKQKLFVRRENATATSVFGNEIAVVGERSGLSKQNEIEFWTRNTKEMFLYEKSKRSCAAGILGITSIQHSPDGLHLLVTGRNRNFTIFKRTTENCFDKVCEEKNAHRRSLSCCVWLDEKTFATGSLDRRVKIWELDCESYVPKKKAKISLSFGVESVAFSKNVESILVGLLNGDVVIIKKIGDNFANSEDGGKFSLKEYFGKDLNGAILTIDVIDFTDKKNCLCATGSRDGVLRIFKLSV